MQDRHQYLLITRTAFGSLTKERTIPYAPFRDVEGTSMIGYLEVRPKLVMALAAAFALTAGLLYRFG